MEEIQANTPASAGLPEGVRQGEVLAGKYRIGPVIGEGAMGVVVAAHHILLNERVAIKFMTFDQWREPDAIQRFVQEARAAVRIQSQHVVRVLDVAVLESGAPYLVMEYLCGKDLAKRLQTDGTIVVEQAVNFMLQACDAISESHQLGIVHRDIKPANLFVVEREGAPPIIKVLDFGISKSMPLVARTTDAAGTLRSGQITRPRSILGSPFYMSPEQMESARDVDARTDIWALGVTLFELITGKFPFSGSSIVQVYSRMMSADVAWKGALGSCPAGLEAIFAKCFAPDRNGRYPTVDAFVRDLAPFGSTGSAHTSPSRPAAFALSESNPGVVKAPTLRPMLGSTHLSLGRNILAALIAGFVGSALFVLGARPTLQGGVPRVTSTATFAGPTASRAPTPQSSPPGSPQGIDSTAEIASRGKGEPSPPAAMVAAVTATASARPHETPSSVRGNPVAQAAPATPSTKISAAASSVVVSATPVGSASFTSERIQILLQSRE